MFHIISRKTLNTLGSWMEWQFIVVLPNRLCFCTYGKGKPLPINHKWAPKSLYLLTSLVLLLELSFDTSARKCHYNWKIKKHE